MTRFYEIWSRVAARYDRDVSDTKSRALELFEESELHALRSFLISESRRAPLLVLDAGCGTGRVLLALARLADRRRGYRRVRYLVGVDISRNMITVAEANLNRMVHSGELGPVWDTRCQFYAGAVDSLEPAIKKVRREMDPKEVPLVRPVVICMLNTLGVMRRQDMDSSLREFFRVIRGGGGCFISVFRWKPETFSTQAELVYSAIPRIAGRLTDDTVIDSKTGDFENWLPGGVKYHSHWFDLDGFRAKVDQARHSVGIPITPEVRPLGQLGLLATCSVPTIHDGAR